MSAAAALREAMRGQRDASGALHLADYGALGDGRSIALSGADGSIDWWCVPNMDSPPLFDRLLDAGEGGYFAITPTAPYTVEQRYRAGSNVLETHFATAGGRAMLVGSLNSGTAGRLPWAELARRIEGVDGTVAFEITVRFGDRAGTVSPYHASIGGHDVFHVGRVIGLFLHSDGVAIEVRDDRGIRARVTVAAGERQTVALVTGADEPLIVPPIADIDARIDLSDQEWRDWSARIRYDGPDRDRLLRNVLALKLLLFSPSGAIAAAGTTSVPERIGSHKNYDYRFAWVRDAGYIIATFLRVGAQAEAKAAFTWLLQRLESHDPKVCYTLNGDVVPPTRVVPLPGYRDSQPVVVGNDATDQRQHGLYGDIFGTAALFVREGNILDSRSAATLSVLADRCADTWRGKDSGIWELSVEQHYTMSKVSCWQALARAVELADSGQLPTTCRDRWARERDRVAAWIDAHCWSDARGAYVSHPGSERLDASIVLAVRFGFPARERLQSTLHVIDRELGCGAFHYRYSGAEDEEGCFLACTFWLAEALALLDDPARADAMLRQALAALDHGVGIYSEMVDPATGEYLGNLPQGFTHLAVVHAMTALGDVTRPGRPAP